MQQTYISFIYIDGSDRTLYLMPDFRVTLSLAYKFYNQKYLRNHLSCN